MHAYFAICFVFVITCVSALSVTAGSQCAKTCVYGNNTWTPDLVCADDDFSTVARGQLLKECIQCESTSLYINGSRNDQYWYLFNMKILQQQCLIDTTLPIAAVQKCQPECNLLKTVLQTLWINKQPFLPQYQYCTLDDNAYQNFAQNCSRCLQSQEGAVILGNMVETMADACADRPLAANNEQVKTNRGLFNTTVVSLASKAVSTDARSSSTGTSGSTSAAATSNSSTDVDVDKNSPSATAHKQGLSTAAAAGIGIGVTLAAVIAAAAVAFVVFRRGQPRLRGKSQMHTQPYEYVPMDMKTKEKKVATHYHEMLDSPARSEIYGQSVQEADGRSVEKAVPVAELPSHPYR